MVRRDQGSKAQRERERERKNWNERGRRERKRGTFIQLFSCLKDDKWPADTRQLLYN